MTKGEFISLTFHLDDDAEILAMSVYDFEDGGGKKFRSIAGAEEMVMYHDEDGDADVIVLLYDDEED